MIGVIITAVYAYVLTTVILKSAMHFTTITTTKEEQEEGLDFFFFGFLAMTISMVVSLYEYPTFATSGFSLVFFLLLGGLLWFIPVALCAAEMATVKGWEKGVSQTKRY